MKLWRVPDGTGEAAYNLESFIGLELDEWHEGAIHRWRVLGVLNGSRIVLFEGSREEATTRYQEALGILTGDRAPFGVSWRGRADG